MTERENSLLQEADVGGASRYELASSGLLSFYDRLRERLSSAVARHGGRWGRATANALLLVPDVFFLLVRLVLDRDVPAESRRLVGGALLYFLLPADLLPEMVVGPVGYLDDLVLACAVLAHVLDPALEPYAARHWSGSGELRGVLSDVVLSGRELLGGGLFGRVEKFLERRGVRLPEADGDDAPESPPPAD